MQLGADQRKLQKVLKQKEKSVNDFGFWVRDESHILQGWEKRQNSSEEISLSGRVDEALLRRGMETPLLQVTTQEFMESLKAAVKSSNRSLNQSEALRGDFVGRFPVLAPLNQQHFLIQFCSQGIPSKFLPSQFAIFLRFLDQPENSMFLLFKKGALEAYQTPDLSGFQGDSTRDSTAVVRFLKNRYGVPVQSIECTFADWMEACDSDTPWKTFLHGVRSRAFHLTPFRWSVVFGLSLKAFLGL
jgi:hypothetical protein